MKLFQELKYLTESHYHYGDLADKEAPEHRFLENETFPCLSPKDLRLNKLPTWYWSHYLGSYFCWRIMGWLPAEVGVWSGWKIPMPCRLHH